MNTFQVSLERGMADKEPYMMLVFSEYNPNGLLVSKIAAIDVKEVTPSNTTNKIVGLIAKLIQVNNMDKDTLVNTLHQMFDMVSVGGDYNGEQ